jgi:hypothetical protein
MPETIHVLLGELNLDGEKYFSRLHILSTAGDLHQRTQYVSDPCTGWKSWMCGSSI